MSQLLRLMECWEKYHAFCVTTSEVARVKLEKYGKVYVVGECNRQHPIRVVQVLMQCIRIVFKERPDVVISTGAAAGCMVCVIGKLLGAKVIWVDSIANIDRLSLSGRIVRPFADLFLTQWPDIANKYKNVEYAGAII
jgi:UDP-N-acetylglucosamine:LPS N-acetylglucosamine transferase